MVSGKNASIRSLLVFDTATERLHVGLAVGDDTWSHESEGGARASSALIPAVLELLCTAGIGLKDLDAIGFGCGPGAFTGLRTACAAAQGLAFGAGKPVLAIDTLMAVAEDARLRSGSSDVWVAMDARMDEIYAAHYRHLGGAWQTAVAPALYAPQALPARWRDEPPASIAGSALAAFGARIDVGAAALVPGAQPSAPALLNCARAAWAGSSAIDASDALPLYIRDRVAFTSAERERRKAEAGA